MLHIPLIRPGVPYRSLDGAHPRLANCLRFTIGTPAENAALLAAQDAAVASAG
mgnify:CR=1 FL=1